MRSYAKIIVESGQPSIRRVDEFFTEWKHVGGILEEYFEQEGAVSVRVELAEMTDEDYEEICENS